MASFTFLLTSSGQEWQFHISTGISSGLEWQFDIDIDHLGVKNGKFTLLLTF